ncbi:hypothetical protein Leryth_021808 [Lithospermum erythrorhizon]|nr:hypothetical protein Leryth_021808 [Lithospermum erythrorhizon]
MPTWHSYTRALSHAESRPISRGLKRVLHWKDITRFYPQPATDQRSNDAFTLLSVGERPINICTFNGDGVGLIYEETYKLYQSLDAATMAEVTLPKEGEIRLRRTK